MEKLDKIVIILLVLLFLMFFLQSSGNEAKKGNLMKGDLQLDLEAKGDDLSS